MRKYILFITLILFTFSIKISAQNNYKAGEFLKFRIQKIEFRKSKNPKRDDRRN